MPHFVRDFEPHPRRTAPDPVAPEAPVVAEPEVPVDTALEPSTAETPVLEAPAASEAPEPPLADI